MRCLAVQYHLGREQRYAQGNAVYFEAFQMQWGASNMMAPTWAFTLSLFRRLAWYILNNAALVHSCNKKQLDMLMHDVVSCLCLAAIQYYVRSTRLCTPPAIARAPAPAKLGCNCTTEPLGPQEKVIRTFPTSCSLYCEFELKNCQSF